MIETIYAEDNLTLVSVSAITDDENAEYKIIKAVSDGGVNIRHLISFPSFGAEKRVALLIKDTELAPAMTALGGVSKELSHFYYCVSGDITRLLILLNESFAEQIISTLAEEGIGIRLFSASAGTAELFTAGTSTGAALNILKKFKSNS